MIQSIRRVRYRDIDAILIRTVKDDVRRRHSGVELEEWLNAAKETGFEPTLVFVTGKHGPVWRIILMDELHSRFPTVAVYDSQKSRYKVIRSTNEAFAHGDTIHSHEIQLDQ